MLGTGQQHSFVTRCGHLMKLSIWLPNLACGKRAEGQLHCISQSDLKPSLQLKRIAVAPKNSKIDRNVIITKLNLWNNIWLHLKTISDDHYWLLKIPIDWWNHSIIDICLPIEFKGHVDQHSIVSSNDYSLLEIHLNSISGMMALPKHLLCKWTMNCQWDNNRPSHEQIYPQRCPSQM